MSRRKVLDDWMMATQEALAALQALAQQLDEWRTASDTVEPDDFLLVFQQLSEAGLLPWPTCSMRSGLKSGARF